MPAHDEKKTVYGHEFEYYEPRQLWYNTKGRPVLIFLPRDEGGELILVVPDAREFLPFTGQDIEPRIFSVATTYINQAH